MLSALPAPLVAFVFLLLGIVLPLFVLAFAITARQDDSYFNYALAVIFVILSIAVWSVLFKGGI